MSWVADAKAISQNTASVSCRNLGAGTTSATPASAAPMTNCSSTIQRRLLPSRSTSGPHSGLMTHGRYSHAVSCAMSVLLTPRFLYSTTASVITVTYGSPWPKYSVGIQRQGLAAAVVVRWLLGKGSVTMAVRGRQRCDVHTD